MGEGDREAVEGERLVAEKAPLWIGQAPYFARLAHPMQDGHRSTMDTCHVQAISLLFAFLFFLLLFLGLQVLLRRKREMAER